MCAYTGGSAPSARRSISWRGRVRDVVLAAHDVRDAHVAVVDRHREVVERAAVRALDHEVLDRRSTGFVTSPSTASWNADLALVGHAEAHRALVLVGVARLEQLLDGLGVARRAAPTARAGPRPSRARASAARRGSARRSRAWSARGRCPRSAARTRRPSRARGASCTVPSSRRRCAARLLGKARNVPSSAAMLIGAHVSTAGGLVQAHERAVERGCEAMQVFNQSPRHVAPDALEARRRGRVPRAR